MNTLHSLKLASLYVALCAGLTIALAAGSSHAASPDEPPSLTVNFSDLDISKPTGARTLYRRIQQAARIVCDVHLAKDPQKAARARACYETAVASAVNQIDRRAVLAVHQAASKPSG